MQAFEVQGKTVTFTGATSAPTPVQCVSNNDVRSTQYMVTNIGTADVFVAWGTSSTSASANAVIPTATSTYGMWVMARTQITITATPDAYFTGITSAGSSIVYVTPGYGE